MGELETLHGLCNKFKHLMWGGGGGGAGLMWGLRLLTIKLSGECGDFPCGKDLRRD